MMLSRAMTGRLVSLICCLIAVSLLVGVSCASAAAPSSAGAGPFGGSRGDETYASVLGNARYFGITAKSWQMRESETNVAVKYLDADQQSGNDLTNPSTQPWVLGEVNGQFILKGDSAEVWGRAEDRPKIRSNVPMTYHSTPQQALNAYVDGMLDSAADQSLSLSRKNSITPGATLPMPSTDAHAPKYMRTHYEIDISDQPDGTFYINLDSVYNDLDEGALTFIKRAKQTIVVNLQNPNPANPKVVYLRKFRVVQDGHTFESDQTGISCSEVSKTIIWNMPEATEVNIGGASWQEHGGSIFGVVLAPKAKVNVVSSSAGWLVADRVVSSSGEWHNIWQNMDRHYDVPGTVGLQLNKTVDGRAPSATQVFAFTAKRVDAPAGAAAFPDAIRRNTGETVSFPNLESYNVDGQYVYRVTEDDAGSSYVKNEQSFFAQVIVTSQSVGDTTTRTVSEPVWYRDADLSNAVEGAPTFTNTTKKTVVPATQSLRLSKTVDGREPSGLEQFDFKIERTRAPAQASQFQYSDPIHNVRGNIEIANLERYVQEGDYVYRVSEINSAGSAYNYNGQAFYAKITVTSQTSGSTTTYSTSNPIWFTDASLTDPVQGAPTFANTTLIANLPATGGSGLGVWAAPIIISLAFAVMVLKLAKSQKGRKQTH